MKTIKPHIYSETGKLNVVITHFPSREIEKMTPYTIKDALYSDILNLKMASEEYSLFRKALQAHSMVLDIRDLLAEVLEQKDAREFLISELKKVDKFDETVEKVLLDFDAENLTKAVVEGYPFDSLTDFYVTPAYNLFFTRDITVVHNDVVLIPKMASKVRAKESLISKTVFMFHPFFRDYKDKIADAGSSEVENIKFEGGDVHIFSDDITLIGRGLRTNDNGIEFIIKNTSKNKKHTYIIQDLPTDLDSFIHLDMVFTVLSANECMVYEPVILSDKYKVTVVEAENGEVIRTNSAGSIIEALKDKGWDMNVILCGSGDELYAPREQWHSGSNFFAAGNGKVLGYERNTMTIKALAEAGYEVIRAEDMDNYNLDTLTKYVVVFPGNELARGGGGARCMTMPVSRD